MIFVEEEDLRFCIKKSTITNAGFGCFAKQFLKKNDWLEVIGIYVKTNGVADLCTHYARRYKFAGSEKADAKIIPMGYAAIVNHSNDPAIQNCKLTFLRGLNKRSQHAGQVVYQFTRDIFLDEEVVGNYGDNISKEINTMNNNFDFYDTNKEEIDKLIKCNLYDLQPIIKNLELL
jgi:hypothetical protein